MFLCLDIRVSGTPTDESGLGRSQNSARPGWFGAAFRLLLDPAGGQLIHGFIALKATQAMQP